MADYPGSIYTGRTMENVPGETYDAAKVQRIYAEDFNLDRAEITAIETILGVNPQGAYSTVKAWLTALAAASGTVAWGSITGTLSAQTDLQSALNAKQDSLGFTPENVANKQTDLTASATKYPTVNAVNTGLATKENSLGFTPENVANKKTSLSDNSDTYYPSQKAVKTAVDGKQDSLGFTPENVANKDTTTTLGTSDTKYPSQNAVKTYVDNQVATAGPVVRSFGTFTKNLADATGTQTIAHGLGVVPKLVRIRGLNPSNGLLAISDGYSDGSTDNCIHEQWSTNSSSTSAAETTLSIYLGTTTSGGSRQTATITLDSTNITIHWTKTSTPSGNAPFIWEAEA